MLRKFINNILGRVDPKYIPIALCKVHDSTKHPILAHDFCQRCSTRLCYICSAEHMKYQHILEIYSYVNSEPPKYKSVESLQKLLMFNRGLMTEVSMQKLRCICGKAATSYFAICAACGMLSCSYKCHSSWANAGFCHFHKNFYKINENISIRSIVFDNIIRFQKSRVPSGTKANKTSSQFVCAYISKNPYTFLLQRGYRIYGHPNYYLLENMTVISKSIDNILHFDRNCECKCHTCSNRGRHSVFNCYNVCGSKRVMAKMELMHDEELKVYCDCQCYFCRSGIVHKSHEKITCAFDCHYSFYRMDD